MAARLYYKPRIWREAASLILAAKSDISKNETSRVLSASGNAKPYQDSTNFNVLLLKRINTMKFMPNITVFPGGQLDKTDMSLEWLHFFDRIGLDKTILVDSLRINGPRPLLFTDKSEFDHPSKNQIISPILPLEIAFRICAIRETFEECGVLIAKPALNVSKDSIINTSTCDAVELSETDIRFWQRKVAEDGKNFLLLCEEKNLCPDIWALHEWWNWLTPCFAFPSRFDTMFYIAFVKTFTRYVLSEDENTDVMFSTPRNLLEKHISNDIELVFPQFYDLLRLAKFEDFNKLSSFAINRKHLGLTCCLPIRIETSDGEIYVLEGDDMYPQDPDYKGTKSKLSIPMTIEEARESSRNIRRGELLTNMKHVTLKINIKEPYGHISPVNF